MKFEERMKRFHETRKAHLAMGGEKKLATRKASGMLNVRERVDYLLDKGTFQEVGLFSHSDQPNMAERSPCDGKVSGFGRIDGRPVGVVANDLTVLGASSGNVNGKKIAYMKRMCGSRGIPVVTTMQGADAYAQAIRALISGELGVTPIQRYHAGEQMRRAHAFRPSNG